MEDFLRLLTALSFTAQNPESSRQPGAVANRTGFGWSNPGWRLFNPSFRGKKLFPKIFPLRIIVYCTISRWCYYPYQSRRNVRLGPTKFPQSLTEAQRKKNHGHSITSKIAKWIMGRSGRWLGQERRQHHDQDSSRQVLDSRCRKSRVEWQRCLNRRHKKQQQHRIHASRAGFTRIRHSPRT